MSFAQILIDAHWSWMSSAQILIDAHPVNIVNQFSSETLQKIRLSCHEVEATIVLENVMKVYTFLRRIRYKKLTQLCVKWFPNRNRND